MKAESKICFFALRDFAKIGLETTEVFWAPCAFLRRDCEAKKGTKIVEKLGKRARPRSKAERPLTGTCQCGIR